MSQFINRNLNLLVLLAIFVASIAVPIAAQQTMQAPASPQMDAFAVSDSRTYRGGLLLDIPREKWDGFEGVNKFGRTTNLDSGVDTDYWDGANPTTDVDEIILPTVARTHVVTSTSANDTAAGTGMQTMALCGLPDWDTAQVCETLTLLGAFSVTTTNEYVAVNRMRGLTSGTSGPNAGIVAARAQTDNTISAQINAGEGQTQMAFFCFASTQTFYITRYYASFLKGPGTAGTVNVTLLVNPEPDSEPTDWLTKHTQATMDTGTSLFSHPFEPYFKIDGPGCAKMQGNGNAANLDGSAGFNGILVDD